MMPSELTAMEIAFFARLAADAEEYEALPDGDKRECESALIAAMGAAGAYTGLDMAVVNQPDLTYAVKVLAAEMIDNRQFSASEAITNPLALQILSMHSTNLLPTPEV